LNSLNKISHKKKQPEDLKIQKPLSLYPMKFDEVLEILLATKPKKYEPKKKECISNKVKVA